MSKRNIEASQVGDGCQLASTLLEKLTPEELSELCLFWDNGVFGADVMLSLLERDAKNNPSKYVVVSNVSYHRRPSNG